ncbi:MAG TPA: pyridoxine 5'-phosphate synthase [Cytophaga sp.]|jgi:pyridoxine 5-phosphate synthase|nr:pyridoxine 5'-phosphate synthase [Cytophaga sp.]
MTRLSVNINKIATLRNARGGNNPDVIKVALDCERFGAEGITIHPRPDERHIRYQDAYELKKVLATEFNIEGNPERSFIKLVEDVKPHQVTLVPDAIDAITSNAGWDTIKHQAFLKETISNFKRLGIRVSVFVDPDPKFVEAAAAAGADRIELYTEPYATKFHSNKAAAIKDYIAAAACAKQLGLGINAGHDLDLFNLNYLKTEIPFLDEVSIGHALVCDALYYGLENTIQLYLRELK